MKEQRVIAQKTIDREKSASFSEADLDASIDLRKKIIRKMLREIEVLEREKAYRFGTGILFTRCMTRIEHFYVMTKLYNRRCLS